MDSDFDAPTLATFLSLLESDLRSGRHVQSLPDDLALAMLASAEQAVNWDGYIGGNVAL